MVEPQGLEWLSYIPVVNWEEVDGLHRIKHDLQRYVACPIMFSERFKRPGVDFMTGYVLHGPLGCGKIQIARSVANEVGVSFMSIKVPDFLQAHAGQSEHELHALFSIARTRPPCLFVLDEVDVLRRGSDTEPVLNRLITELDHNYDQWQGVFVIGATNRPEMIEHDLIRPDRFGKLLYVPLPSADERFLILRALTRYHPVDASVDLNALARIKACENLNGADLTQLANEALMAAIEEHLSSSESTWNTFTIKANHFVTALRIVCPSVSGVKKHPPQD